MKLFAALSLVVSTIVTWVLMLTYRPTPVLSQATLFSFEGIQQPLDPQEAQLVKAMQDHGIQLDALVFTGTHQHVYLNVPELGKLEWLQNENADQRNQMAARRLRSLMQVVWKLAQHQLPEEGVNVNQIQSLGLLLPRSNRPVEISNSLEKWGL
ncbi:hypothetical protein [Deinococcus misasensis]|uniref:hypothetical protein n=1 Tax=Deinococcus misasensis TaxID=392413 RepID=UPI000556D4C1|nr:hypothetical protein [Deinococcus misasensis]